MAGWTNALNCDDFEEIVMFLAQRKKLKKEMSNG